MPQRNLNKYSGSSVEVQLSDETKFEGVFSAANPNDLSLSLKQAKKVGDSKIHTNLNFAGSTIHSLSVKGLKNADAVRSGRSEPWDQFAVNEQKFGVSTDFNEDIYTTVLDKSGHDFKKREAEAARIAREIEKGVSNNAHIAEERGQTVAQDDSDEETKYSSVIRKETLPPTIPNGRPISFPASVGSAISPTKSTLKTAVKSVIPKPGEIQKKAPINATMIRKTSIDQITSVPRMKSANAVKPTVSIQENPVKDGPKSAKTSEPPIDGKHLANFKPFSKNLTNHLIDRRQEIINEGRRGMIENLKQFSLEFQIPPTLTKKAPEDPLLKEITKEKGKEESKSERVPSPTKKPTASAAAKQAEGTKAWGPATSNSEAKKPPTEKPVAAKATEAKPPKPTAPKEVKSLSAVEVKDELAKQNSTKRSQSPPKDKKKVELQKQEVKVEKNPEAELQSVVSEADSHATNTTNASKKISKLNANAAEFTPSSFSAIPQNNFYKKKDKNHKFNKQGGPQYYPQEGYYVPDPNFNPQYYPQPGYYPPPMRGYPQVPMQPVYPGHYIPPMNYPMMPNYPGGLLELTCRTTTTIPNDATAIWV
ncbi:hypothetical protein HK103_000952 [Boothiomyces macroporosus]|uniref:Ig-like domain-containing protein n=1 Tax=Boothiomyces macroporosus TaxID=261099 RepID=A0AAD5UKX8_9FUNG|nr:hypothetical protein HK103_000952 [Boothiomyces macroporosus]